MDAVPILSLSMKMIHRLHISLAIVLLGVASTSCLSQWRYLAKLPGTPTTCFFWDARSGLVGCTPNWANAPANGPISLYKTVDGGISWTTVTLPAAISNFVGSITSIRMVDRLNGWMTIHATGISWNTFPGLYRTSDGGNSWAVVPNSVQWNNVLQSKNGNLFLSNGGIGALSDSVCMVSTGLQPVNNGKFVSLGCYLTSNAGTTWKGVGLGQEAWGLYYQKTTGTFFVYGEMPLGIGQSTRLWFSSDTGSSWNPGPSAPGITTCSNPINTTGDIEGSGPAFYIQSICGPGMYRCTDQGQSWQFVNGPSNVADTRFFVLPTCRGGSVIAFDKDGGVWLTTDGGDGALKEDDTSAIIVNAIPRVKACDASKVMARIFSNACPNGLRVDSIALVGDTIHFALDSVAALPKTFGGGTSDSFYVRFTPLKQSGNFTTHLHVRGVNFLPDTSLPFDTLITITATATPESPSLLSSLTQFNFDSLSTCGGLRDTSVVFINTGCTSDTLTNVSILGSGFSWLRDSLPIIIASGDSVRLRFRFVPPDSGSFSGTAALTVVSMGLTQTPQLGFSGVGVRGKAILNVQSTSIQAGSFSICVGDTTFTDTLRNTGCDTLTLRNIHIMTDEQTINLLSSDRDTTIAPNGELVFTLHFRPWWTGQHHAWLSFMSWSLHSHDTIRYDTVNIFGLGTPGSKYISANLANADFGSVFVCQSRDTTITLHNTGCDVLTVFGDSVRGASGPYRIDTNFPIVIAPGDSAKVRLHLTADSAGMNGVLVFQSNADTGTVSVPLTASIILPARLHLTLTSPDSAKSGSTVTYDVILTGDASGLSGLHFDITHNDDLLGYTSGLAPSKTSGPSTAQVQHFDLKPIPNGDTIGLLQFNVYLADSITTSLTLSNITFDNTLGLAPDCIASIDDSGSAFTYITACGDGLIRQYMAAGAFEILSVQPNPARDEFTISFTKSEDVPVRYEIDDALGRAVARGETEQNGSPTIQLTLSASNLPSGVLLLRVSAGGFVRTQRFVVAK